MDKHYADLHIHIGRTKNGRAVKITGAKTLTLQNILKTSSEQKGLDIIGIIDCHSPGVLEELEEMKKTGELVELDGGGLRYLQTTLIPGVEMELYDQRCRGPIHVLAYFPTIDTIKAFAGWLEGHVRNPHLSTQRNYCDGITLQRKVKSLGGLFIPAHVFTPFKSLFGKGVDKSLTEVFNADMIDGIELGLSSDTRMAGGIRELNRYPFLSNSDAHSLGKIAREYQSLLLENPTFAELEMALHEQGGRKVAANYGLNPELGKYHTTVCAKCLNNRKEEEAVCGVCGSGKIIRGVSARIAELSDGTEEWKRARPPYIHQVPLEFIPGLGPKTFAKLLEVFGTEMNILHKVTVEELKQVVPEKIARYIDLARRGELKFEAGGGGKFGSVKGG